MQTQNPIFCSFLEEVIEREREKPNSKLLLTYQRALDSLKNYPLPLQSGKEATALKYIGPKIGSYIDQKYEKYRLERNIASPKVPSIPAHPPAVIPVVPPSAASSEPRRERKDKLYIPSFRSGGYGILLALYRNSTREATLSKMDLIELAQPFTEKSFTMAVAGSYYTAWSSMATLLKKDLVEMPRRGQYMLTEDGRKVATILNQSLNANPERETVFEPESVKYHTLPSETKQKNYVQVFATHLDLTTDSEAVDHETLMYQLQNTEILTTDTFSLGRFASEVEQERLALSKFSGALPRLDRGTFEIIIVLDNREVRKRADRDYFQVQLRNRGVEVHTTVLALGDVAWAARKNGQLYLLDYILERKGNDDLRTSIMDNRFKEQKFRLNKCGMTNRIYLVEGFDPRVMNTKAMYTALTETMILSDFFVKETANAEETADYLANMTKTVKKMYENEDLYILKNMEVETHHSLKQGLLRTRSETFVIPLDEFNNLNSKTYQLTPFDIWQKQLLTIKGVSLEKASVISRAYPSFKSLMMALYQCSNLDDQLKIFTSLSQGASKTIGKALARKIVQVFMEE